MKDIKKLTTLSMLLAGAIVLNVIEMSINVIPVPGAKIGFANLVTVIILYMYGFKEASLVTILRVLLIGLLYRSFTVTFWMGLGGAVLSIITMGVLKNFLKVHMVTVSVLGAITHTIGQVLVGIYLLETELLILYLPLMLLISIPAGILIGIISTRFFKIFNPKNKQNTRFS
ncbi:Heptaprenyl diphosphate synthase component I [Acholeplasma oculi]|uniref:Heptaprenyl diphosphate synthase component I n=1 Tax=Acholeplasma oculi TaxID=35623 RepID=A0A061ADF2_9MOLU|nr:Gx transporter family protein [Acholeplasma oculi]CDR31459.1 Heptaprenyl diphosphate synthase component I [Acholeplasma oculi]SKC48933.1 heptaprenyl diphosphate synthase [Acholeplasma oculi]SUT92122.1 Heptaprenyl diphosphate synthase component I [Acholeplasma oculi]